MELTRHLLLILILHLSAFCCQANVTSVKRKKASTKPHGRHVANKRGRSILCDPHGGNETLANVSPVEVESIKGSPQQQESRIKSIYPVEKIRDERKKRRKRKRHMKKFLKKWRDNSASLVGYKNPYPKRKCRNWSQCKKDECCIRYSSTNGYCKKRPQKGDRCKPILLPGLRDCPCDQGLTCTRYKTTKWGLRKHKCERVKRPVDEVEQRYV